MDRMHEFRAKVKKFIPIVKDAKEKSLNEADTRMRIRLLLSEVLGYDMLQEITQEHMVQGHYVDMTVKTSLWNKEAGKYKETILFFIEAKAVETVLRDTHAYQATNYAATGGVNLCVLTNGIDYRLYHLTWDKAKVENSIVLSLNMLDDDVDSLAEKLYLLSKESFKKGIISKYISESISLADKNVARAMFSERVMTAIRKELKAITGHNAKDEAIRRILEKHFDSQYCVGGGSERKPARKPKKEIAPVAEPVKLEIVGQDTKVQ